MSEAFQSIKPEALDQLAHIIGNFYTSSQITELFGRSGYRDIVHDSSTKWRFIAEAFKDIQHRGSGSPNGVLRVLECLCSPQAYIGQRDEFLSILREVNAVLEFYGLCIDEEGKLLRMQEPTKTVRQTKTEDERAFNSRNFHPKVIEHGRQRFSEGNYFHSVFECCKAFDAAVRYNSGINKSGDALMGEALSPTGPIKLNSQTTQSENDEQKGIMFLCKGLMSAVRNPQAHEPELSWKMTQQDALDVLAMLSFLFRKLENAIVISSHNSAGVQVNL